MTDQRLTTAALQLREVLARRDQRIVLAESCTAGRIAATLSLLPGISGWLCGSFVVYRNESKAQWLGIDRRLLEDPQIGPVSQLVTEQLAEAALQSTAEAGCALAITGHVGPGVQEPQLDGQIYCALAHTGSATVLSRGWRLTSPAPRDLTDLAAREARLVEATQLALDAASQWLTDSAPG
jgi:nicotinamide-nucleotide amidase